MSNPSTKIKFTIFSVAIGIAMFLVVSTGAVVACQPTGSGQGVIDATIFNNTPQVGCDTDTSIIQSILTTAFGLLAVISVIFVAIGGVRYALSGGDANAVASAKKTILYAVVGLVLGVSVFTITDFIFNQVVL